MFNDTIHIIWLGAVGFYAWSWALDYLVSLY